MSSESAHIENAGPDGPSGAEDTESAHIENAGPSGAEDIESAYIENAGPDGPSGAENTDVVSIGPRSGLQYVRMTPAMCPALAVLELETFPSVNPADLYDEGELLKLAADFPEGSVVGFDGDDRNYPVALGLGVRTHFDFDHPQHSLKEMLADSPTESGDDPDAPWYYGTDIVVRPNYRRRGIGRELYDMRKQMCVDLNLAGIVAGGVIPGYADHKDELTADEYVAKVVAGELYDPTLTFQVKSGFEAPCALSNYLRDPEVNNHAALIVWHNVRYRP